MLALHDRSAECGKGAVPVPDRVTVAGEFVAVLTNDTEPLAAPLPPGVKVTVACLFAPAVIVVGSVRPLTVKPDPVTFAALTVTDPVPVFESVTVLLELPPTRTLPNERLVGEALSRNVAAAVAVPDRVTTGGVFGALLVTVNEPEKVPAAPGANFTDSVVD